MGICLSFLVFDGREDAPTSRLLRAFDALLAWGHAGPFRVQPDFNAPRAEFERLARGVGLSAAAVRHPYFELAAGDARAAIAAFARPEWLNVAVACPIASMDLRIPQVASIDPGVGTKEHRAIQRGRLGDVELGVHKVGRRFFENPLERSEEAERLHGELAGERAAGRRWRVEELLRDIHDLAGRNERERRALLFALFEALATSFGAASVRAHLDDRDTLAPLSSLAYYRDAQALCDDVALLADTAELDGRWPPGEILGWALRQAPDGALGAPFDAAEVPRLLARLRRVRPGEVERKVASSSFVLPLAEGFLMANETVLPVGTPLVPFFASLLDDAAHA